MEFCPYSSPHLEREMVCVAVLGRWGCWGSGSGKPPACISFLTNHHKLGGLKEQKFILAQFWKLEVRNQGVGRACIF